MHTKAKMGPNNEFNVNSYFFFIFINIKFYKYFYKTKCYVTILSQFLNALRVGGIVKTFDIFYCNIYLIWVQLSVRINFDARQKHILTFLLYGIPTLYHTNYNSIVNKKGHVQVPSIPLYIKEWFYGKHLIYLKRIGNYK